MAFDDIQDVNQPLVQDQQLQDENQIQQNTDNISLPVIDLDQAEQQDPPTKAQQLYRNLIGAKKKDGTSKYTADDLGTEDEFSTALSDSAKADNIYSKLISDGYTIDDLGDKNEFLSTFVTQKKNDGKNLQDGTTATSQSELPYPSRVPKATDGQIEPVPQPKEIDPNNLFEVAKKAKTLKSTAGGVYVSGGTGGASVTTTVDQSKLDEANKLNTQIKTSGYDADKLANDAEGINDAYWKTPEYSPTRLLTLYKDNPQLYERTIATAKYGSSLFNSINADENITNDEKSKLKGDIVQYSKNIYDPNLGLEDIRGNVQSMVNIAKQVGGDKSEDILNNMYKVFSGIYAAKKINTDDPLLTKLSENQALAYKLLQDIQPTEANRYKSVFIDDNDIADNYDAKVQKEIASKRLEELGIQIKKNWAVENVNTYQKEYETLYNKLKDGTGTQEDYNRALELEAKINPYKETYTALDNEEQGLSEKFPKASYLEARNIAQEFVGQEYGGIANILGKTGYGLLNTVKGAWNIIKTPFQTEEENEKDQTALLGEKAQIESVLYQTQETAYTKTADYKLSPELQKQIDAIYADTSLTKKERTRKATELIYSNRKDVEIKPIEGGKTNISATSLLYGIGNMGAGLAPFLLAEYMSGGGATATYASNFMRTFTAAAMSSFNDEYAAAIERGSKNPYADAMMSTAIHSAAMAGAGAPDAIRRMLGNKTPIGRLVDKMSDEEILIALRTEPKALSVFKKTYNIGKNVGEAAIGGTKEAAKFVAMTTTGRVVNDAVMNTLDTAEHYSNEAMLEFMNVAVFNSTLGVLGKITKGGGITDITSINKDALHLAAQKPIEFLKLVSDKVKNGTYTPEQGRQITNNIMNANRVLQSTPMLDANGNELSHEAQRDLLFLKMQKNDLEATLNKDISKDLASKIGDRLVEIDAKMDKIYKGTLLEPVTVVSKTKNRLSKLTNAVINDAIETGQIPKEEADKITDRQSKIDFIENVANEAQDPAKAQELRKKYGDDVVDHALQLKPIEAQEVKPIADTEITSTFGAASAFIPSKDLETAQTTINKVNNAENINEGEIKATENILYTALDKHPEAAHLIEPLILKLQDHEFTTKTETVETTERVPVEGTFAAKRQIETKPALEATTGSEATVTLADGTTHTGTLEIENGNYVIKAEGKEPVVIGEKQITDRDLKLPSEDRVPQPFKMDKDGNLESVSLETRDGHIVEVKGDKALDVAIKLQAEAVGEIPDAAFEQAYEDVVTTHKIEVPVEKPKVEKVEPTEAKTTEPIKEGEKKTEGEPTTGTTTKRKTASEKIKERRERKKQEKKQQELPPTERPQGTRPPEVHTAESIEFADTRGYDSTQKKLIKDAKNVAEAIADIVKELTGNDPKIIIHSNDASFIKAAEKASGEDQSQLKGKGFYFGTDGTIHVNMVRASKETIKHEGFHPLLDFITNNSKGTLSKLYKQLESIPGIDKLLRDVKDTYAGEVETTIQKEAITDFVAKVADGSIVINASNFEKIKNFVVKLLNKLGLGLEEKEILNIKGAKELQDLAQLITGKFGKGEKITAQELRQSVGIDGKELTPTNKTESGYVDANGNPISNGKLEFSLSPQFKDYKGDFKYEYSKDSDKFKKLKEDGYITEDKTISNFDGVTGILHTADHAFTGDIYKGKDKIVSGKGGIFNTVEFHDFGEMWRSTPTAANSMANALNASLKASPDGKARLFLVSSPQDKTLSSSLNSMGMIEILTSKAFDQRVRISEKEMRAGIVTGVENAKKIILDDIYKESVAKTIDNLSKKAEENKKPFDLNSRKVQQEIRDNAKKAVDKKKSELPEFTKDDNLKTVQEKLNLFYPPDASTFSDRKTINLRILEGVASKIRSEEGRTQLKDFIETLGGEKLKGKKPSMANLTEGFSNILNEPMLKNTPSRKIYAVIETDGEVEAVDAGGHISYNKAIRTKDPNKKVTIHILQDRPTWTDVTKDPQTGELITPQREKNVLPTNKGMSDVVTISAPKKEGVSFSKEKPLSSQTKLEQDAESRKAKTTGEVKVNSEKVQYNGTDAIGSRQRTESEQIASRNQAKEKIKNPETNASLKSANSYNKEAGLPKVTQHKYKPSDPVQQTQVAKLYPKLQDVNSPTYKETDLERRIFTEYKQKYPKIFEQYDIKDYKDLVHKAYGQLIEETQAQYDRLPVKVSFHENGEGNYENNFEMLDDVHNFNHLWVYKGGDDHTELGSKTIDKDGLTANDKFRAVHDYYGHSVEGYQFGKDGEENAWIEHSKMFSPLAQWALSSETRGQNSWVNYSGINEVVLQEIKLGSALKKEGKRLGNQEMIDEGEKLLSTVYDKFQFAEQKAMLLPPQYTDISKFHKDVIKEVPQNLLTYDKENKSRIPSSIRVGEKPVSAKPIEGAGTEKTSTGGNVQASGNGAKGEGSVKFSKEKEVEKFKSKAVENDYKGYKLFTREIAPDHYVTYGEDANGNKISTESTPNEDMMSMEKAQQLIDEQPKIQFSKTKTKEYVRDEKGNYYPTNVDLPKGFKITEDYDGNEGYGILYDNYGYRIEQGDVKDLADTIKKSYPIGTPKIKDATTLDLYSNIDKFTLKQFETILQNLDSNGDWSNMVSEVDKQPNEYKAKKLETELLAESRKALDGIVKDMLKGDKADEYIGFDIPKDGLGKQELPQQKIQLSKEKGDVKVYHYTNENIKDFDEFKGGIWFTTNSSGYPLKKGLTNKIERYINPNELNLANEKQVFQAGNGDYKKGLEEIKKQGFDGVKRMVDGDKEFYIFNKSKLKIPKQEVQLSKEKGQERTPEETIKDAGLTEEKVEQWRKENKVSQKTLRVPSVQDAAEKLKKGEITQDQYIAIVRKDQPIKPFTEVPKLPSIQAVVSSLDKNKVAKGIVGVNVEIPDNARVGLRLDIPAYENYDTYVMSIHDSAGDSPKGEAIGYGQAGIIKNVNFVQAKSVPKAALDIATGKPKASIARMYGDWQNESPEVIYERAKKLINDPEWKQVGLNLFRHSWFYDKADGMPIKSASEVIQVGALVLAKDVVKANPNDIIFKAGEANGEPVFFSKENKDDLNEMKDILREYTDQGYSLDDVKEIMKEEFGDDYAGEEATIEQAYHELTTTSVKNKTTARERAERGLDEVEVEAKRSFGEAFDRATKMIDDGEVTPSVFAATIANKPRPLTAEESVILLKDRMDLSKDYGITTQQLLDAQDKGDEAKATVLRATLDELEMKMDINDQAAKKSGYELGLGLAARRMLINRDYSLATQLPRLKASAGGKEVPKEYKDKLTTLVKELEKATADLENQERKTLADDVIKQIAKIKVVKKPEAEVKKERETIKERLLNIWNSFTKGKTEEGKVKFAKAPQTVSPRQAQLEAITPEVKKLVKSYAEAGITDIEDIIDGVHKDISSVIKGITREEARDAILGKYKVEPIKAALTPKEIAAKANVDRVKLEIDLLNKKLQLEQRGKGELAMDYLQGWHRFAILSGIPSLGKIGVAATMRGITTRAEGLVGQVLSYVPGIRQIAKGAPREGRMSASAEAKAFVTWFDKMTREDFRRVIKTGKSELDILYGGKGEMLEKFPAWMEFFGRMHGAMKLLPKRAEFFRSLEMRTEYAIKQGLDPREPSVQAELTAAAYNDALAAVFMQDHPLTTAYKRALDSLEKFEVRGVSAKPVVTAMRFLLPIIKVPTNYVAEESSYMIGGLKALYALRRLFKEGGMTSEQKDYFMRSLKKQSIGVAFMFLGYLNPQAFGGYYTGKRKEKDLEAGDIELAGVKLPHWMSHSPLLEMLQVGATLRRASDKEVLKGNEPSMVKGIPDVFKGQVKQVPFFGGAERISKSMESGDDAFDYYGGFAKSLLEPQILQNASDLITYIQDKKEFGESVKRIPSGFKEQLIEGTPFRGSLEKEKQLFTKEEKSEGILQLLQDKGVELPFIKQRRKLKVVQDEDHPEGIMSKEEYDTYAEKLNKKVKEKIKETLSGTYEIKEGNKYSYKSGKSLEGKDLEDKIKKAEGEASREVLEEMKLLPKEKRSVTKLD